MRSIRNVLVMSSVLSACLGAAGFAMDGEWPQWRGPERTGIIDESVPFPTSLSGEMGLTEAWSVSLGPSYSGPIVVDGLVLTTETVDAKSERVVAYRLDDGELVWEQQWEGAMSVPFFAKKNGDWIRATPSVADGKVYVSGMRDVLVCLDLKTGSEVWRCDFVERFKTALPAFGYVSSPLVEDGAVYTQAGGAVCKLDANTGEVLWRSLNSGEGMDSAFSSPVIATLAGVRQLVVQTREELCGVDMETGQVLWNQPVEAFRGMNILTPTIQGDTIFTSAYGGRANAWSVTQGTEGEWKVAMLWDEKHQGYMSSPVLIGECLYLHLRNTRFACISLATGEENWITKPVGDYWSMIAQGDRILSLADNGVLRLIEATPVEYRELDSLQVAEDSWAHIALAGNTVVVRHLGGLKVYRF